VRKALDTVYSGATTQPPLPPASLPNHPSENEIVREALTEHRERLEAELRTAAPGIVVTLGNAALRVFRGLDIVKITSGDPGRRLQSDVTTYGQPATVTIDGRTAEWLPLAHPAAPPAYQAAHEVWRDGR
jgi:hypothetical protein